jgi:hypothetical protein
MGSTLQNNTAHAIGMKGILCEIQNLFPSHAREVRKKIVNGEMKRWWGGGEVPLSAQQIPHVLTSTRIGIQLLRGSYSGIRTNLHTKQSDRKRGGGGGGQNQLKKELC